MYNITRHISCYCLPVYTLHTASYPCYCGWPLMSTCNCEPSPLSLSPPYPYVPPLFLPFLPQSLLVTLVYTQTLKLMKDRERLRNYINQIPLGRQREFRGKICALVDNTVRYCYSHVFYIVEVTMYCFFSSANKMEDSLSIL